MASEAQLPLAMVGPNETARVARVRGDADLRQHLAELGFVEGSSVKVVSRAASRAPAWRSTARWRAASRWFSSLLAPARPAGEKGSA